VTETGGVLTGGLSDISGLQHLQSEAILYDITFSFYAFMAIVYYVISN